MHIATSKLQISTVNLLLLKGANVDARDDNVYWNIFVTNIPEGATPLMMLLSEAFVTEVLGEKLGNIVTIANALLLHGADLYARDLAGKTVSILFSASVYHTLIFDKGVSPTVLAMLVSERTCI